MGIHFFEFGEKGMRDVVLMEKNLARTFIPSLSILYWFIIIFTHRSAFSLSNWFGVFPIVYDRNKKLFSTSRRGLLISFAHVVIAGLETYKCLTMLFFGTAKKTSALTAIVFSVNGFGSMFLLLRRIAFVGNTVKCYNGLSDDWPADVPVRKSSDLILYASASALLMEFLGENVARWMKDQPFKLDQLTAYASLGFEMQLIHTFQTIGGLYSDLNEYVGSGASGLVDDYLERIRWARKRNMALYTFCKKFNSHYSVDLIVHLSCYQLYVLFVLFNFAKILSTSFATENFIDLNIFLSLIRMTRLFAVFIYLIESSSYLHHKSVFTCYCILRSRVNYLRHQTKDQICLFLNELNVTEVTITASHCYDVNYAFLYSVSGSIVAYLILVVSFLYD